MENNIFHLNQFNLKITRYLEFRHDIKVKLHPIHHFLQNLNIL